MKEKAIKKQSFLNRKKAEWKEMKLWNADELCRVDWIVSILILTVLCSTEIGKTSLELIEKDSLLSVIYQYDPLIQIFTKIF